MVNVNHRIDASVYALHAGDLIFRYVGATSKNSQNRLYEHIYRARTGHTGPVYEWMRAVGIENVRVVDLIKVSDPADRATAEAGLIERLLVAGFPLVNQKSRDGKIDSMSAESKERVSSQKRGKPTWIKGKSGIEAGWTEERRANQSAVMKARRAA